MLKVLLGAMGGIFVGALLVEVIRRKRPSTAEAIERKAREVAQRMGIPVADEEFEYQTAEVMR